MIVKNVIPEKIHEMIHNNRSWCIKCKYTPLFQITDLTKDGFEYESATISRSAISKMLNKYRYIPKSSMGGTSKDKTSKDN